MSLQLRVSPQRNLERVIVGMYCSCSAGRELVAQLSHVKQSTGYMGDMGGGGQVFRP